MFFSLSGIFWSEKRLHYPSGPRAQQRGVIVTLVTPPAWARGGRRPSFRDDGALTELFAIAALFSDSPSDGELPLDGFGCWRMWLITIVVALTRIVEGRSSVA